MRIAEQEINADNKTSRHLWKFIAFLMIYSRKQIIGSEEQYDFPDPEKKSKLQEFKCIIWEKSSWIPKKYKFQDQKEFQEVEWIIDSAIKYWQLGSSLAVVKNLDKIYIFILSR